MNETLKKSILGDGRFSKIQLSENIAIVLTTIDKDENRFTNSIIECSMQNVAISEQREKRINTNLCSNQLVANLLFVMAGIDRYFFYLNG